VKPDIVFFGERLQKRFFRTIMEDIRAFAKAYFRKAYLKI